MMPEDSEIFEKVEATLQRLASEGHIVRIFRSKLENSDVCSEGFIVDVSKALLMLHRLSDRFDLDGYEILKLSDITRVVSEHPKKLLFEKVARFKNLKPLKPSGIDIGSMRTALASIDKHYPLIVVERERHSPGTCEVGKVVVLGSKRFALRLLDTNGEWVSESERHNIDEITRLTFDGEYENTLAVAANLLDPSTRRFR